jgi:hypothetical protein
LNQQEGLTSEDLKLLHRADADVEAGAADRGSSSSSSSSSGPLYWAFSKLLDWGAASPRVTLLTATHLSALLDLNPDLLVQYRPLVKRILLYSSGGKGEGTHLSRQY